MNNAVLYVVPLGRSKNCGFREPAERSKTSTFRVNFMLHALRKLITRTRSDQIKGIIKKEARLFPGDNPLKTARLLFHQCRQELRI
jgi:hypothetical protein